MLYPVMEGEVPTPAERKNYPLTVSRTATCQELTPSSSSTLSPSTPSPPNSAAPQAPHASRENVTSKGAGGQGGRSRFYFESDTLALKNNPE